MSREVAPRKLGFITLHPPGLLTDDKEATLDLMQGGAARHHSLDDLVTERVVYMQLVGASTETQNTPRNGSHIAVLHILDTEKSERQGVSPHTWGLGSECGGSDNKPRHHG